MPRLFPAHQKMALLLGSMLLVVAGILFLAARPAPTTPADSTHSRPVNGLAAPPVSSPLATATRTAIPSVALTPTANPQFPLLGRRIGLDPGHGPRGDMGAVLVDPDTGKLIMSEAEFNLDVALRCRDLLRARGANVVLTRETADTFTAPWPSDANGDGSVGTSKDDLQERIDILNAFHSEVFLSIHVNSAPKGKNAEGVQVFYCSTSDCPFPAESKRLGGLVVDQLQVKLALAGHPIESHELHGDLWLGDGHLFLLGPANPPGHVRATQMPGVLAESLYINATAQTAQLKQDGVRQAIALAYADALQAYLTGDGQK